MGSKWDIGRKQLEDTFSSRKFLLIFGLFLLLSVGSVHLGVNEFEEEMDRYEQGAGAAPDEPSLIDVFGFMAGFNLPLAAGILAILLSYDSVSKEREEGTIELLLSYPVYRDEVINGKFLSGLFTVALALLIAFIAASGYVIFRIGQLPELSEVSRLGFMWIGSVVYMAFFYGLGILFSTALRSSRRALISSMVLLMIFIATPFLLGMVAGHIYEYDSSANHHAQPSQIEVVDTEVEGERIIEDRPEPDHSSGDSREEVMAERTRFTERYSRFSPSTSYQNYVGLMIGTEYDGEFPPTLEESLQQASGYLVFLISQTMLVFATAYTIFMRQDL